MFLIHRAAHLGVAGDDAEHGLIARLRDLGIGADRRHQDAVVVVDARSGNRHARVVRAQHELDACVGELLRHVHALLGIALVVLGLQLEAQGVAAHLELLRVEFFDGEAHAVLVVLAGEGVRARQRTAHADFDDLFGGVGMGGEQRRQRQRRHVHFEWHSLGLRYFATDAIIA